MIISTGFVSLTEQGEKVPVTILRDSAALSSFILASVLLFSEKSDTGCSELVRGTDLLCLLQCTACRFCTGGSDTCGSSKVASGRCSGNSGE